MQSVRIAESAVAFRKIGANAVDGTHQLNADGVLGVSIPFDCDPPNLVRQLLEPLVHLSAFDRGVGAAHLPWPTSGRTPNTKDRTPNTLLNTISCIPLLSAAPHLVKRNGLDGVDALNDFSKIGYCFEFF